MQDLKPEIFSRLKALMAHYVGRMKVVKNDEKTYELVLIKNFTMNGKKMDSLYFATAIIQKNFVGFYFFPIYTHPAAFAGMPVELRKMLKGKSCFHVKKWDEATESNLEALIMQGYELYSEIKEGTLMDLRQSN